MDLGWLFCWVGFAVLSVCRYCEWQEQLKGDEVWNLPLDANDFQIKTNQFFRVIFGGKKLNLYISYLKSTDKNSSR